MTIGFGLSQPSSLFLILAAFLLEAFAALILAVVTFRLIEKYLPYLVN